MLDKVFVNLQRLKAATDKEKEQLYSEGFPVIKLLIFTRQKPIIKLLSEKKGLAEGILLPIISIISREERVRLCRNAGKVNDWNWNLRLL